MIVESGLLILSHLIWIRGYSVDPHRVARFSMLCYAPFLTIYRRFMPT